MIKLSIDFFGDKWWMCNNNFHRTDGPAIVDANGYRIWYINNNRHRLDGPAVISPRGRIEYWVNGQHVSEYEHMFLTNN